MQYLFVLWFIAVKPEQKYAHCLAEAKSQETLKRKAADAVDKLVQAKKKLTSLEEEVNSCLTEADKKAKSSQKKHDFKLLAQSVALREGDCNASEGSERAAQSCRWAKVKIGSSSSVDSHMLFCIFPWFLKSFRFVFFFSTNSADDA